MQRFGVILAMVAIGVLGLAGPARAAGKKTVYKAPKAVKIDIMGEWAHPDDDTSIIGPCGVWHERYGVRCGEIMVTRGEGGGNAVGQEIGPALGLRRENEDRVAHFRSRTVDIFNLDRVDFFYNTSAPLTQFFWGHDETLRRITRIIRMTQPEIYIGFTPTLGAGHGNHQQAGRFIWEGVLAAADPSMFPEQLRGRRALSTWQVKKVFSRRHRPRAPAGRRPTPDCTTGFMPAADNLDTVAGVWLGYDSPYDWPAGNVQGQPAGTAKSWAQVHSEGRARLPDAEPRDVQGRRPAELLALRDDAVVRPVPAQRQPRRHAQPGGRQGRRDPLRRDEARSGRAAEGHARVPDVLALLQHARHDLPDHRPSQGGQARAPRRPRWRSTCRPAGPPSRRSGSAASRAPAGRSRSTSPRAPAPP